MNIMNKTLSILILGALPALALAAGEHAGGHSMQGQEMAGMQTGAHGDAHASMAGKPGNPAAVSRTIKISALDTMRYDTKDIQAKPGETVRFVITNAGKIKHEFTIGTREEQMEHAKMMASMPGMKHEDGNSVSLEAGETKELVWQFGKAGPVEIACHVPGHYEAGMTAKVSVKNNGSL